MPSLDLNIRDNSDSPSSSAEVFYDAPSSIPIFSKHEIHKGGSSVDEPDASDNDDESEREAQVDSPSSMEGQEVNFALDIGTSVSSLQLSSNEVVRTGFVSQLAHPKSLYDGYEPPLPVSKEGHVVEELLEELLRQKANGLGKIRGGSPNTSEDDFVEFELSDFSIFLPDKKHHAFELRPLQHLFTKMVASSFMFDGILRVGSVRRYVQRVPFVICSIGNYGQDSHSVDGNIWIKSEYNSKSEVYYRLKTPTPEYERFHEGFLWLADLAKHFVDYCHSCKKHEVSVFNFRHDFSHWICENHGESPEFRDWYQRGGGRDDFRQAVAANIQFLFKESIGVNESLRSQPIWAELMEKNAIPKQAIKEEKTIVTPYVYECFKDLPFGSQLKSVEPVGTSKSEQACEVPSPHLTSSYQGDHSQAPIKRRAIRVGDVVSVTKDGKDSVWKDEPSRYKTEDQCWYVYIQAIHEAENKEPSFDAIWLYKPSDTSCAKMKYPFEKELFMSDNCVCGKNKITSDDVIDIEPVLWNCGPLHSKNQLFIRQTYLENEKFVTLTEEHKLCKHRRPSHSNSTTIHGYPVGRTVLVGAQRKNKYRLEPHEIMEYVTDDQGKEKVVLRQLLRRQEVDGRGKPNELVYSDETYIIPAQRLERICRVRLYTEADIVAEKIPAPYSRDGAGNSFYITTRLCDTPNGPALIPIQNDFPKTLIQGFDPKIPPSRRPLRGMDLYCGGGNFGRGIEEGGAVRNEWAVDIYDAAIHTYYANLEHRNNTKLFFGSVNDLLIQALRRNTNKLIPQRGEVEYISAGSPCQGFSVLNSLRGNDKGLRNQSLVASVAAYIDFYRPKYGLLENVMTMAQMGRGRDQDVLSQLICAIVGMGYQLQLFVLDAWSCGSPQSRSRLFVSFAAPGLVPLEHPELSHSHPPSVRERGLGKLANGQYFGERRVELTPFDYVTAKEATQHLPNIGDGNTHQCTSFPYHVLAQGISADMKTQIDTIPKYPRGMNFAKAWNEGKGIMTQTQRDLFPYLTKNGKVRNSIQPNSRAWGRVNPHGIYPTIVVTTTPWDSRMGTCIHWDEDRCMTVAEAQIAQGFPDNEVLAGDPRDWWKILGNSVCRNVSLALGLSLRKAWLKSPPDNGSKILPIKVHTRADVAKSNELSPRVLQDTPIRPGMTVSRLQTSVKVQVTTESSLVSGNPSPLDSRLLSSRVTTIQIQEGFKSQGHALEEPRGAVSLPLTNRASLENNTGLSKGPAKSLKRPHSQLRKTKILSPSRHSIASGMESDMDSQDTTDPTDTSTETRILPPKRSRKVPRLTGQASMLSDAKNSDSDDDQAGFWGTTKSRSSGKVAYSSQSSSNVQVVINLISDDESVKEKPRTKKYSRESLPNANASSTVRS